MLVAVKKLKQGIVSREEDLISFMAEVRRVAGNMYDEIHLDYFSTYIPYPINA